MAAGGLPAEHPESVVNTVRAALDMAIFIEQRSREQRRKGRIAFDMRTGINSGQVIAGIVGTRKFQYDIWGDTVNTASRMESRGEVGRVNISASKYELIKENPAFVFESRGMVDVKGKGQVGMYIVNYENGG